MNMSVAIFLGGAVALGAGSAALATMRRRGACGEAWLGAWVSGLLAVGGLIVAGLLQWHVDHQSPPRDWRMDAVDRCISYADEGCQPAVMAEKLSGWR